MNVFLDESGNSGRNYLDPEQPFYVLGGWAVASNKLDNCRKVLKEWESEFSKSRQGSELKSTSVIRRRNGLDKTLELMGSLIEVGAAPTCCVFEKRFGICVNLAETFFPDQFRFGTDSDISLPDAKERRDLADFLYSILSNDLLSRFAEAVYKKDLIAFTQVQEDLFYELIDNGADSLAAPLSVVSAEDIASFPFSGANPINSINATVFHTQIMLLEHLCRSCKLPAWKLLHDETASFEEILRFTINHFSEMPTNTIKQTNGLTLYFGQLCLDGLEFLKSEHEPLIRCSDHYVGFMNYFFKRMLSGHPLDVRGKRHVKALLSATILGLPSLQFFTLSPGMHTQLSRLGI